MRGPHGEDLPGAIHFACTMNAVRSPMAAAIMKHLFGKFIYIDSAGVRAGMLDPMAVEVMEEIGIEIAKYHPKRFEDLVDRSEEHTSELQSRLHLVCRLLLEKKTYNTQASKLFTSLTSTHRGTTHSLAA